MLLDNKLLQEHTEHHKSVAPQKLPVLHSLDYVTVP